MPRSADESEFVGIVLKDDKPWSRFHRDFFRFVFCFIALYAADLLAVFLWRQGQNQKGLPITVILWHPLILWIGQHVLHLAYPIRFQEYVGQDGVYEYILRGTELVLAVAASVVWHFLDPVRREYRTLNAYLRLVVRVVLASEMLYYGFGKVPPSQFGVLSLGRQAQPFGQMWPMAILWAFMAASPGYTLICGLVEVAGGLLLLTRKTTALGALISMGAMGNVMLLNVFYDVNQKMRCVYYVLLAFYLAAPELPGLWRLLVTRLPAAPVLEPKLLGPRSLRLALLSLPFVFGILQIVYDVPHDWRRYYAQRLTDASRGPNYGIWRVDSFAIADPHKPLFSQETLREFGLPAGHDTWYQVIFDSGDQVLIELENGQYNYVDATQDKATGDTLLSDSGDREWHARLQFQRKSPISLLAVGTVNGDQVRMVLSRQGDGKNHPADLPHWISDGRRW
jgi:uncharacterized membrane protein YphA (DoxX/SURF4 family)